MGCMGHAACKEGIRNADQWQNFVSVLMDVWVP